MSLGYVVMYGLPNSQLRHPSEVYPTEEAAEEAVKEHNVQCEKLNLTIRYSVHDMPVIVTEK